MTRDLVAVELDADSAVETLEDRWAAGDAVAALPSGQPPAERAVWLAELRPAALITGDGRTQVRQDGIPVDEATDLVVATSGSSGAPKGVELTRAALSASADASVERIGAGPHDTWACCLPVHHVAGLQVLWRARRSGASVVAIDAGELAGSGATRVSLVPTQLTRLLEAGVDLSGLTTVLLGGAAVPAGVRERAQAAGVPVIATYGMTETCGGVAYDGVALRGVQMRDHGGRIAVRGPMVARRYRLRPDLDSAFADGWFTTGDAGRVDGDRVVVHGRADDLIVTGGENVAPSAVEAALAAHPEVAAVAVTGRTDMEWGQVVVAVVVPRDPRTPPTLGALRDHVKARASAPHAPRRLALVAAIPEVGPGKVDRVALRRLAEAAEG